MFILDLSLDVVGKVCKAQVAHQAGAIPVSTPPWMGH